MIFKVRGMSPKERAEMENLKAQLKIEKQRNDDYEVALVELAELAADQDDAIVELAGLL